jgi:hypothetical protein
VGKLLKRVEYFLKRYKIRITQYAIMFFGERDERVISPEIIMNREIEISKQLGKYHKRKGAGYECLKLCFA